MIEIDDIMRELSLMYSKELEVREREIRRMVAEVREWLEMAKEDLLTDLPPDSSEAQQVLSQVEEIVRELLKVLDQLAERQVKDTTTRWGHDFNRFFKMMQSLTRRDKEQEARMFDSIFREEDVTRRK